MGNILSLQRNGLHDNNTYDVIDDLSYTYNGNQVIRIDDDAVDPVYNGCFNFKDGADEDIEYEYDQNGNLTMDLNREICSIAYNCLNLPQRVDFQDGSYVLYTYNAGGEKMRTDYYILDTRTLDTPDILEEMAFMEELYKTAVEKGIGNGTNITYMLQNADFSQSNFQGWETSRTNSGNFYSRTGAKADGWQQYSDIWLGEGSNFQLKSGTYVIKTDKGSIKRAYK